MPPAEPAPPAAASTEPPAAVDVPVDGAATEPTSFARRNYSHHLPYYLPSHSRVYVGGPATPPGAPPSIRPYYVPVPGQPRIYVIAPTEPRTMAAKPAELPPVTGTPPPAATIQCVALVRHRLAWGSGFAVGKKLVVTNAHVVEGAFPDEIKVQFGAENSTPQPIARILHYDRARDLCVMEVPSCALPGLPVRGDYELHSGDQVTLLGNPSASSNSDILVRNAVNHGKLANMVQIEHQGFYQIEASVNPGWSGGPVLDADGRVVAVVARKANDRAVTEIREAMKKLDEGFRGRVGLQSYNVGLTYGIPASAVAGILKDPALYDEDRQAEANDHCAAKTLADRLSFLAELCFIRMSLNPPEEVRKEGRGAARGKSSPTGGRVIAVRPRTVSSSALTDHEARTLRTSLESEAITTMEDIYRKRIDERVEEIQSSPTLPDGVKRDLRLLAQRVREGTKYAEHPTGTLAAHSAKVKGFAHDFKEYLKRLAEGLKEKES
jgi:S1-C subfamily serine protease